MGFSLGLSPIVGDELGGSFREFRSSLAKVLDAASGGDAQVRTDHPI